jgi:ABC-type protease/lipase transport system fused ATPase/permease subunit
VSICPSLDRSVVGNVLFLVGFLAIPSAMALAILKYRLYDIDVVINRTLVYGALSVTLALLYFGSIAVLQGAWIALTGQRSQLAVVASTLLIAALFNPIRHRIQSFIDRRFYRRKYDAAKTLESFSHRLRDEVDLENLSGELLGVVEQTIQPAHVSLWLRDREERARMQKYR